MELLCDSPNCNGFSCCETQLIRAHIIPRAFVRAFQGDGPNMTLSIENTRKARPQQGEYDENTLCAHCDNELGKYDKYALEVCAMFPQEHRAVDRKVFELSPFDGEKFSRFVLAVLWRASLSQRKIFGQVALGKYQAIANEILLGGKSFSALSGFRVLVERYTSEHIDITGFCTIPVRTKVLGLNAYRFGLGGFGITAVLDNRPLPSTFGPFAVSGDTLRGLFTVLENTHEFKAMAEMVVAEAHRKGVPPWEL
jgi:hypothetical protein